MLLNQEKIILGWRYFLLLISIILFGYLVQNNFVLSQELTYSVDFKDGLTRDVFGLYPLNRTNFLPANKQLAVLAEPLYLQAYIPDGYSKLSIVGNISSPVRADIGLKQSDGSWQWQELAKGEFTTGFDLSSAAINNNKLQIIFSFPDLMDPGSITFNDLKLILKR